MDCHQRSTFKKSAIAFIYLYPNVCCDITAANVSAADWMYANICDVREHSFSLRTESPSPAASSSNVEGLSSGTTFCIINDIGAHRP